MSLSHAVMLGVIRFDGALAKKKFGGARADVAREAGRETPVGGDVSSSNTDNGTVLVVWPAGAGGHFNQD